MNTPEKYVAAYIVESLTGIRGSNPERVHEVLRESDFAINDPFLALVYDIARFNPDSQEVRDAVAGLVIGQTVLTNKKIAKAIEMTIEESIKNRQQENRPSELRYSVHEGTMYCTLVLRKNGKDVMEAAVNVPEELKDFTLETFLKRFPDAFVVEEE